LRLSVEERLCREEETVYRQLGNDFLDCARSKNKIYFFNKKKTPSFHLEARNEFLDVVSETKKLESVISAKDKVIKRQRIPNANIHEEVHLQAAKNEHLRRRVF
jgi:hypothetical protein